MEKSVNERLKKARKHLRLTQREFAEKLAMGQSAYSAIENGINSITQRTALLICNAHKVNPEWLLHNRGEMLLQEEPKDNYREKLAGELLHFQGVLIGKLGEKTWKELEPYFPKYRVYQSSL